MGYSSRTKYRFDSKFPDQPKKLVTRPGITNFKLSNIKQLS